MRIYLVHHGAAMPASADYRRPLSADGRRAIEHLAGKAAQRGARPSVVWHSGKLRARQTAEVFWHACNPLAEFSAARGLQPTDPPDWMADVLVGETRDIMIVGHMPLVERLLRLLIEGKAEGTAAFPVHGVVALETTDDRLVECWRLEDEAS